MNTNFTKDNDVVDKLNAFYIYVNAGGERVREIFPHLEPFCRQHENKSYGELRNQLLNQNHNRR